MMKMKIQIETYGQSEMEETEIETKGDFDCVSFSWEDKEGNPHKISIRQGAYLERHGIHVSGSGISSTLQITPIASNVIAVSTKE